MGHKIISLSERDAWERELSGMNYLPAHTWEYCSAMSAASGMETALFVETTAQRKVICPFSVRSKEEGLRDLVSPYGFGGILATDMENGAPASPGGWKAFWRANGAVTAYIMQHPLSRLANDVGEGGEVTEMHRLFQIDLARSIEELWQAMHSAHRYQVRHDEASGTIEILCDEAGLKQALFALYPQTLDRLQASKVYYFGRTTLEALASMKGALIVGARDADTVQAVSLFLSTPHGADYFLNAATQEGRKYSRSFVWKAIKELKNRSVPSLNLGGGVRPGDSLEAFKRRFGGSPVSGQVLRQVFDPEKYTYLMKYCENVDARGYFPPYWKERQTAEAVA
jgi:hypothetical protein